MKYSSNYLYVLNHACAGNPGLRAVVEELLAAGRGRTFFSKSRSAHNVQINGLIGDTNATIDNTV